MLINTLSPTHTQTHTDIAVGGSCILVSGGSARSMLGRLMRSPGPLISLITQILLSSALLFSLALHSSEVDSQTQHTHTHTHTHTLINTLKTSLLTLTLSTTCCLLHSTLKEKGWVCVLNLTTHWWCSYFNEECGQENAKVKQHQSCRYISQATDNRYTTHDILLYFTLRWCFINYVMFSHPPEHIHVTVVVDKASHYQNFLEVVWIMLKRNNTFDLFIHSPEWSIQVV